jgi:hypothetical protein
MRLALPHTPAFLISIGLAVAGCVPTAGEPGGFCGDDFGCNPEYVCDNFGACARPESLRSVSIRWTIYGQTADEISCEGIDELRVTFEDFDTGDSTTFAPVLCPQGLITFTRVPTRFDGVNVTAHDQNDWVVDNARLALQNGPTALDIDFQPM